MGNKRQESTSVYFVLLQMKASNYPINFQATATFRKKLGSHNKHTSFMPYLHLYVALATEEIHVFFYEQSFFPTQPKRCLTIS